MSLKTTYTYSRVFHYVVSAKKPGIPKQQARYNHETGGYDTVYQVITNNNYNYIIQRALI
jgi:hypothetical protein